MAQAFMHEAYFEYVFIHVERKLKKTPQKYSNIVFQATTTKETEANLGLLQKRRKKVICGCHPANSLGSEINYKLVLYCNKYILFE